MATTPITGIYSPDTVAGYMPVQDLGAMATSVENALIERANAFRGTAAQRNANSDAPLGTLWADTDADRDVWKMGGSGWELVNPTPPPRDQRGTLTITLSNANAGTTTASLEAGRFSSPPLVYFSKQSGSLAKYIPYLSEVTTTSVKIGVYSGDASSASGSVKIAWWAIPQED